jgi:superfamily II DNA or RNA helicase
LLWDGLFESSGSPKPRVIDGFRERPYQARARAAIMESFTRHDSVLVELATGLGKTEIFTQIMSTWTDGRCMVIAPLITLVSQAADKISLRTGEFPGIEQAKNWSNETPWGRSSFVVASKDTLVSGDPPRYTRIRDVGLVVVDEAHLSITKSWEELLAHFRDQGAKILGVTATAKRADKKSMRNMYRECAFQYGISEAVKDGWLVNPKTTCVQLESLDLSHVDMKNTTLGKDFVAKQLNTELEKLETIYEISAVTAKETLGKKTVVYCSSVEEARLVAERLQDNYGIQSGWICADQKRCTPERRREELKSFTKDPNGITHLCNVGILTTGWDYPGLECIVMARPTASKPLYQQILGRGTRPLPGLVDHLDSTPSSRKAAVAFSTKPHFTMIDLVDASLCHKIITCADVMVGEMGIDVIERTKEKILESDETLEIDEAALEAKRELEREEEERMRGKRARIEANAKYRSIDVDPFSRHSEAGVARRQKRGARFVFGKFKGELVEEVPTWYLRGCSRGKPFFSMSWLRTAVSKELKKREGAPPPYEGQI